MLDQRLDPKRERWINAGFILATVAVAIVLFIIAGRFALDEESGNADQIPSKTAQQSRASK